MFFFLYEIECHWLDGVNKSIEKLLELIFYEKYILLYDLTQSNFYFGTQLFFLVIFIFKWSHIVEHRGEEDYLGWNLEELLCCFGWILIYGRY